MLKAKFFEPTNLLVVTGDDILPAQIKTDGSDDFWHSVDGLDGKPKYDINIWFDEEWGFQFVPLEMSDLDDGYLIPTNDYQKGELKVHTEMNVSDMAEKIYDKKGQSAVFDFANEIGIEKYEHCKPCETESPVLEGAFRTCLVCGTSLDYKGTVEEKEEVDTIVVNFDEHDIEDMMHKIHKGETHFATWRYELNGKPVDVKITMGSDEH